MCSAASDIRYASSCAGYAGRPRPTLLRDLGAGSVILFGSKLSGQFVRDTVFVGMESALHDASSPEQAAPEWSASDHRHAPSRPGEESAGGASKRSTAALPLKVPTGRTWKVTAVQEL